MPKGKKNKKNGIVTYPKNFIALKNELEIATSLVCGSFVSGVVITVFAEVVMTASKTWLVNPSILFESSRRVTIGIKIRIKMQINNKYFRYENLSFLNLKKKIIDNGITKSNASYLTMDASARSINEIKNNFLFLTNANTNTKLTSSK
tara:strand:- start:98 stop:541 length:444 start_codon:yes stop_codon:yes gene_type:complete